LSQQPSKLFVSKSLSDSARDSLSRFTTPTTTRCMKNNFCKVSLPLIPPVFVLPPYKSMLELASKLSRGMTSALSHLTVYYSEVSFQVVKKILSTLSLDAGREKK